MLKLPDPLKPRMLTALAYPALTGEVSWVAGLSLNTSSLDVAWMFCNSSLDTTLTE